MIAAELAVALVLLVGAGLLIRSSLALQRTTQDSIPPASSRRGSRCRPRRTADRSAVVNVLERLAESARTIPGVTAAGITSQVPMGPGGNGNGLLREGLGFEAKNLIQSRLRMVTPDYFEAMRIPIVKGRALTADDRRGGQLVMVISEALARAAFPNEDPIGQRIACCEAGADGKSPSFKVVVGVAGDVRWRGPAEAPTPEFYLPIASGAGRGVGMGAAHDVRRRPHRSRSRGRWRIRSRRVVRERRPASPSSRCGRWKSGCRVRWRRRASTRRC